MKSIKMLGLAAFAALTAMAFVGSSSAMAEYTALCTTDEVPCEAGNRISHVHETTLSGQKATLSNSISNVLCDVLFLGDVTAAGLLSERLFVKGSFAYTNCVDEKPNPCTVAEENGPSEIEFFKEGHEDARVLGGLVLLKVVCSGISCKYEGVTTGSGLGPLLSVETNGSIKLSGGLGKVSGLLCPSIMNLFMAVTPLAATYISS